MVIAGKYNSKPDFDLESSEWKLALAAHFLDMDIDSPSETSIILERIAVFLAQ